MSRNLDCVGSQTNQHNQIDRQNEFGTEPFVIEDALFDFFPFDVINRILDLENKRKDYIQRLNNNPQIFPVLSQEAGSAYDSRYVREIWENYEIYNTETFRWEPLQVLNKFCIIGMNEYFIDQCPNIRNTSYIDVLILDKIWYFSHMRDRLNGNFFRHLPPFANIFFSQQTMNIIRFLTLPPFIRKRHDSLSCQSQLNA